MWLTALVSSACAQVAAYDLTSPFSFQGNAWMDDDGIELVPSLHNREGSAWAGSFELPSPGGFRATFEVALEPAWDDGGGGLVFALQGEAEDAIGADSEGMAYEGISPSLGVELDIWQSYGTNDPDGNHVGIDLDGSITSAALAPVAFPIDGQPSVFGRVDHLAGEIRVWLDVAPIPEPPGDPLLIFPHAGLAGPLWVGFTASSGGDRTARSVRAFSFVADGDHDSDGTLDFEDPDAPEPEPTGDTGVTGDDDDDDDGTTGGPDTDEPPGQQDPPDSGDTGDTGLDLPRVFFCGCTTGPAASPLPLGLFGLLGLLWRRRRA
jgi:MYXO-CTERM domain-containing protein